MHQDRWVACVWLTTHIAVLMKILEYVGLDTSRVKTSYQKVAAAIARLDFRGAQVKKLANLSHGKFYRAKLDGADRLLFSLVRYQGEVCVLMLEVIANHEYDKSRFLRGAPIDEDKIADSHADEAIRDAEPVRYLNPQSTAIHLLDKPISFDDAQEAIYRHPPPLIVVGSAGSGKTALTLEKLKHAQGEVLYVTHSRYLAQSARATCITATDSSTARKRRSFSPIASSSNPSASLPDGRPVGAISLAGFCACAIPSKGWMPIRYLKKFVV